MLSQTTHRTYLNDVISACAAYNYNNASIVRPIAIRATSSHPRWLSAVLTTASGHHTAVYPGTDRTAAGAR